MFVRRSKVWFGFVKKDVYVLLGEIQKNCLFNSEDVDCHPSLYSFTNNERSFKCTAWSLRLLEGTMQPFSVFVITKFMSSYVICLVIAR